MSSLIDLIFLSEKRKNLLVQLANGPMNIDEIKEVLDVKSCALMPQIKVALAHPAASNGVCSAPALWF